MKSFVWTNPLRFWDVDMLDMDIQIEHNKWDYGRMKAMPPSNQRLNEKQVSA